MHLIVKGLTRNDDGTWRMEYDDGSVVERCEVDIVGDDPITINIKPLISVDKVDVRVIVDG